MTHSPYLFRVATHVRVKSPFVLPAVLLFLLLIANASKALAASGTPTSTTLTAPTVVANGDVCVLTATVSANGAPVAAGFVTFLEGAVPLGQAAIQTNGTATFRIGLPPGVFSISASFNGSNTGAPSASAGATVTQLGQSSTALSSNGTAGEYTLTAIVTGNQAVTPSGTVTFKDETTGTVLGQANLTPVGAQSTINSYFVNNFENSATFGDFNGDGRPDYANIGPYGSGNDEELVVNLANADGSYTPVVAASYGTGLPPEIFAAGDFNGDGRTDLVLSQLDTASDTTSLTVLLSDGNGYFTDGNSITGLTSLGTGVVGDFNGDGKLDLMITTAITPNQPELMFYPGDGAGNLGAGQPSSSEIWAPFLAADFNQDGNLDLMLQTNTTPNAGPGPFSVYLGQGNGTGFTALPQSIFGIYAPIPAPIVADFNGDGIPDLALFNGTTSVTVLLGDGKGNFNPAPNPVTDVGSHTYGYGLAMDVNGDGIMDLVLFVQDASGSGLGENGNGAPLDMLVLLGDGTGHFSVSPEVPEASIGSLAYPNSPVPFTLPALGTDLIVPVAPQVATSTATLSGVSVTGSGLQSVVAIYNGNEVLPESASQPVELGPGISFSQGFTPDSGQANGSATLAGTALQLTDGKPNETGSFFYPQPVDIRGFVTDFDFQLTNAQADGFTFTIQNVNPYALGGTGGSLGYAGIPDSVAVKFDLFNNAGEGDNSTGLFTNGAMPTVPATDLSPVNLHSGDVLHARIVYGDYDSLKVVVSDATTGQSVEQDYTIDLFNTIGTNTAYVGFTAATGGLTATQDILNWTYSPLPNYVLELPPPQGRTPYMTASGLVLNGPARIITNYNELRLIDAGAADQASSAYFSTPVDVRKFTTDFSFQASNAIADGFTFVLQNAGISAVGPSGGGLGYGPDTPWGNAGGGIPQSMAIKFDFYSNAGEGSDSTGLYLDGASPTVPATNLAGTGIVLTSGDIFDAHLAYDGTTLTVTLTDAVTGAAATQTYTVNIPAAVGGNTALAGFTAATGALSAQENILTWTYEPTDTIALPDSGSQNRKFGPQAPAAEPKTKELSHASARDLN